MLKEMRLRKQHPVKTYHIKGFHQIQHSKESAHELPKGKIMPNTVPRAVQKRCGKSQCGNYSSIHPMTLAPRTGSLCSKIASCMSFGAVVKKRLSCTNATAANSIRKNAAISASESKL
jgi:hypothetical protein